MRDEELAASLFKLSPRFYSYALPTLASLLYLSMVTWSVAEHKSVSATGQVAAIVACGLFCLLLLPYFVFLPFAYAVTKTSLLILIPYGTLLILLTLAVQLRRQRQQEWRE